MTIRRVPLLAALLFLVACDYEDCNFHVDDDDDAGGDDDDDAGDDDDAVVNPVEVCGEIVAVDRESGTRLSGEGYRSYAGVIVVYATRGERDLLDPLAKTVLYDGPADYCMTLEGDSGGVSISAIADWNRNNIIESRDTYREYPRNPVWIGLDDVNGVDITLDLGRHGGGGGSVDRVRVSGVTDLINVDDGPIAITANGADYSSPVDWTDIAESGPYGLGVRTSLGSTAILGYLDADDNGVWEPSDWVGEAPANPISLELGDVEGVRVVIPSIEPIDVPLPPAYTTITGNVEAPGFVGGDIIVTASNGDITGFIYSRTELAAPGDFVLRVPPFSNDVVVWAVLDDDADGFWDLAEDANDAAPMIEFVSGPVGGVSLTLGAPGASISGSVSWAGGTQPGDILYVGLYTSPQYTGNPYATLEIPDPTSPQAFQFVNLPPGIYYPSAFLDIGGDNEEGPGLEDLSGVAGGGVEVEAGELATGVNFSIPN